MLPDELIAGRYRLVRLVGTGGMGSVWEAWDERLHRPVAVKQLHAQLGLSPEETELANQRAMREARITARLHHRHAVPVFDVVEHQGRPCLIMQFLPSMTLSAVLRESGPLQPEEAAQVGAQISSALAAAHAVGIVHRDVKPGNILIADDGAALITDFGISHALGDTTLTATGLVHGTPAFLAPEVARGSESTFASDVFSLGSTLYAALEGAPPFGTDSNSIALLHRVASGEFPPPQHGGPLTPVVLQMLSLDPQARPSMKAAADTLRSLSARGAEPAPELSATPTKPMEPVSAPAAPAPPASPGRGPPRPAPIGSPTPSTAASTSRRRRNQSTVPNARLTPGRSTGAAASKKPRGDLGRRRARRRAGGGRRLVALPRSTARSWLTRAARQFHLGGSPRNARGCISFTVDEPDDRLDAPPTSTSPTAHADAGERVHRRRPSSLARSPSYYALVPDQTDRSWTLMTESYQTGTTRRPQGLREILGRGQPRLGERGDRQSAGQGTRRPSPTSTRTVGWSGNGRRSDWSMTTAPSRSTPPRCSAAARDND